MNFVPLKADCIATSAYVDGDLIGINIPLTMPEITPATIEVRAAGGMITLPIVQQLQSMETTLTKNGLDEKFLSMLKPEPFDLMFNIVQQSVDSDGISKMEHIKVFERVIPKSIASFGVTPGEQGDKQVTFTVLTHKIIVDGREYLNIDPLKGIYKVNGVDYNDKVRSML